MELVDENEEYEQEEHEQGSAERQDEGHHSHNPFGSLAHAATGAAKRLSGQMHLPYAAPHASHGHDRGYQEYVEAESRALNVEAAGGEGKARHSHNPLSAMSSAAHSVGSHIHVPQAMSNAAHSIGSHVHVPHAMSDAAHSIGSHLHVPHLQMLHLHHHVEAHGEENTTEQGDHAPAEAPTSDQPESRDVDNMDSLPVEGGEMQPSFDYLAEDHTAGLATEELRDVYIPELDLPRLPQAPTSWWRCCGKPPEGRPRSNTVKAAHDPHEALGLACCRSDNHAKGPKRPIDQMCYIHCSQWGREIFDGL